MAKTFINLTPHALKINSGEVLPASGTIARVKAFFSDFDADGICRQQFGEVEGLPAAEKDTIYIVSALVLAALKGSRGDVVAPATGHPAVVRENGLIVSVPGFVQ